MYCYSNTCAWKGTSASECNSQFDRWKGGHCLRKTGSEFECPSEESNSNGGSESSNDDPKKATCDSFSCSSSSSYNKGSGVSCSGDVNSCDDTLCCASKATCNSFSCSLSSSYNKGSGVSCSGDATSCDATLCCASKATCDSFLCFNKDTLSNGGEEIETNKGSGVSCSGDANSCDDSTCCDITKSSGCDRQTSSVATIDFSMCSDSSAASADECYRKIRKEQKAAWDSHGKRNRRLLMSCDTCDDSTSQAAYLTHLEQTCGFNQRLATCFPSCYCDWDESDAGGVHYGKCWDDHFTWMANEGKKSGVQCELVRCGFAPPTIHAVSTHLLCLLAVFLSIF